MRLLSELSIGDRIALTFIIAIIILFVLAAFGYFGGRWNEEAQKPGIVEYLLASIDSRAEEVPLCMDESTREQIKTVMMEALDNSLKTHIEHVFEVWLKD